MCEQLSVRRRPSAWAVACWLALALGFTAQAVRAQSVASAGIQGKVTDETGATLPGVTVTVTSPVLQVPQITAATAVDGAYRFVDLPAGVYRVTYELQGFQAAVREGLRLSVGFTAKVDVVLKVGALQESVTVSGQGPVVDVAHTATSVNLPKEVLDAIPRGRGLWDIFAMTPGVTTGGTPDVGDSNLANRQNIANYGVFAQPKLEIEGINVTTGDQLSSAVYLDYFAFDEVQVKASGNDAEVSVPGVSMVGIIKSGGNQFHGTYLASYQGPKLQSSNITDQLRAQGLKQGETLRHYYDVSGDLGGRILRDKLWFYGALSRQERVSHLLGFAKSPGPDGVYLTADDVPADYTSRLDNATLKLSYQLSKSNKFIAVWQPALKRQPQNGAGRFRPLESTRDYRQPNGVWKGEFQSAPSQKVLFNVVGGWGGYFANYSAARAGFDKPGHPSRFDRETGLRTGVYERSDQRPRDRWQIDGSVSLFPNEFLGGKHELKAGSTFYWEHAASGFLNHVAGNYELIFDRVGGVSRQPVEIITRNFPLKPDNRATVYATYLKDTWRISDRLTANLGVRWERQHSYLPKQTKEQGQFGSAGTFPPVDVQTWIRAVPRLGLAWDLKGDGKTVVKATHGWYNYTIGDDFAELYNQNALVETRYRWRDLDGNGDYTPGEVNLDVNGPDFISISGARNNILNPNLKEPITYETTVGLERELVPNVALRMLYVYKRLHNFFDKPGPNVLRPFSAYNIPLTRRDPGPDGTLGTADDAGSVTFYDYDVAFRGARFVGNKVTNSRRDDSFHTVEVTLTKRTSQKWSGMASFWATKNHRWLTKIPESPNDDFFPLDETWNWAGTVSGSYLLPYGVQIGAFLQSKAGIRGQRTYVFRRTDPDGGPVIQQLGTVTLRLEPFGKRRGPAINSLNLRGGKQFSLGGGRRLEVNVDLFNVLNSSSATGFTWISGPTFGYVTDILPARVVRLGVRYSF